VEPSGKAGSHGPPNHGTHFRRWDGRDHTKQEHGNHALTQRDPGHSTTTTSIPLQRRGNSNYTTYSPLYANSDASTAYPRRYRSTQDEAWPQYVAPADGEAKRSTPTASLRYKGNCSHQIRRKTAAPKATFFVFLFYLFPISPFYYKYNPSPPLENYKRGGRGHI
jgi:hypothetical protein